MRDLVAELRRELGDRLTWASMSVTSLNGATVGASMIPLATLLAGRGFGAPVWLLAVQLRGAAGGLIQMAAWAPRSERLTLAGMPHAAVGTLLAAALLAAITPVYGPWWLALYVVGYGALVLTTGGVGASVLSLASTVYATGAVILARNCAVILGGIASLWTMAVWPAGGAVVSVALAVLQGAAAWLLARRWSAGRA